MPAVELDTTAVGQGIAALVVLGTMARYALPVVIKRLGLTNIGTEAQGDLITRLEQDAERWRKIHEADKVEWEKLRKAIEEERDQVKELCHQLKAQNAILRMLVMQKGATEDEMAALSAIENFDIGGRAA